MRLGFPHIDPSYTKNSLLCSDFVIKATWRVKSSSPSVEVGNDSMARVGKLGGKGEMSVLETSTLGLCEAWIWE